MNKEEAIKKIIELRKDVKNCGYNSDKSWYSGRIYQLKLDFDIKEDELGNLSTAPQLIKYTAEDVIEDIKIALCLTLKNWPYCNKCKNCIKINRFLRELKERESESKIKEENKEFEKLIQDIVCADNEVQQAKAIWELKELVKKLATIRGAEHLVEMLKKELLYVISEDGDEILAKVDKTLAEFKRNPFKKGVSSPKETKEFKDKVVKVFMKNIDKEMHTEESEGKE